MNVRFSSNMRAITGKMAAFLVFCALIGGVYGLECWRCIADDCHVDPSTNYKATKVTCNDEAASCQKVEYVGRDSATKEDYESVVRSCSQGECIPHSDNCSDSLKTNPGCMVRHCCNSHSLCNTSSNMDDKGLLLILMLVMYILHKTL